MNLADAAELVLLLSLKDEVSSGLKGIQGELDKTNTKGATLSGGLTKIGQGLGTGIKNTAKIGAVGLAALWTQVDAGIDSLVELEDVQLATEAVIKSTGGTAGLTAEEIRKMAVEFEDLSGVDDKVIQSAENVMLTFTKVGEDVFPAATLAALDMSQAMGTDLQSSVVQIGKALNDPIQGITALTRVGVSFSEEQKKVIAAMVETGDVAGAQQLILDELNKEFGGQAAASMEGYRGTQLRLKDTVEDLQMALAEALLPALRKVSEKLNEFLKDPEVKEGIKRLGEGIAGLFSNENIKGGGDALKGLFTFLKELPWDTIKSGLQFAADNAKKVVDVFRSLPPGVQAGLLTFLAANKLTGGLVASGLGELVKVALGSLKTITAANVTVIGNNVTDGPGQGNKGPGTAAKAIAAVSIAGAAALFIDQIGVGFGNQLRTIPLHTDAARFMQTSGFANLFQWAGSSPIGQVGQNILGPGFGNLWRAINDFGQQSRGFDAKQAEATRITNLIAGQQRLAMETLNQKTQIGNQIGVDHRMELQRIHGIAQQQKNLQSIGNHAASEAKDRLASIQVSSQRTAAKDFSTTVHTHTTLSVNGYKIAQALTHMNIIQGGQTWGGGQ